MYTESVAQKSSKRIVSPSRVTEIESAVVIRRNILNVLRLFHEKPVFNSSSFNTFGLIKSESTPKLKSLGEVSPEFANDKFKIYVTNHLFTYNTGLSDDDIAKIKVWGKVIKTMASDY